MELALKFIYYILHTFTGCDDSDLEWFKNNKGTCTKCGRIYFGWSK